MKNFILILTIFPTGAAEPEIFVGLPKESHRLEKPSESYAGDVIGQLGKYSLIAELDDLNDEGKDRLNINLGCSGLTDDIKLELIKEGRDFHGKFTRTNGHRKETGSAKGYFQPLDDDLFVRPEGKKPIKVEL